MIQVTSMTDLSQKNETPLLLTYYSRLRKVKFEGDAFMTKNLHTADLLAKLSLAILTILSYLSEAISGPFAVVLMSLSILVLLIYAVKAFISIKNESE